MMYQYVRNVYYLRIIKMKNKFRKTEEELKKLDNENDIKLSKLWEYLRRRNNKKIQKETISNVKNNS